MKLNSCPLLPRSYFADMKGWDLEYTEVPNTIVKRWNLPAAQLVNLASNSLRQFYCVNPSENERDLNEVLNEDCLSYCVISAIRYLMADMNNYNTCITTCLMSHKAASLNYRSQPHQLILADGKEASIFQIINPYEPLQLTYSDTDKEGRRYQITVDMDVDVVKNDEFNDRGIVSVNFTSPEENLAVEEINPIAEEKERESAMSQSLNDAIAYLKSANTPYIFDSDSYPYIEKFLCIVQNHIALV